VPGSQAERKERVSSIASDQVEVIWAACFFAGWAEAKVVSLAAGMGRKIRDLLAFSKRSSCSLPRLMAYPGFLGLFCPDLFGFPPPMVLDLAEAAQFTPRDPSVVLRDHLLTATSAPGFCL
jgi:hypothetical protein